MKKKIIIGLLILLVLGGFTYWRIKTKSQNKTQYQTAIAEIGTLVISIPGSGTISSGSSINVTTKISGIVKSVLVKNGQSVTKGQKIAQITLDDNAQAQKTITWAAYVDAVNNEKAAEAKKIDTDIAMWKARQAIFDALDDQKYRNDNAINPDTKKDYTDSEKMIIDKTVNYSRKNFEATELAYINADAQISKAKAETTESWLNYLLTSDIITTPMSGIINNLTLAPEMTINQSTSAQTIANIVNPKAQYQAVINLTESDVTKVKPDQKVTLTLDAYSDKTFTGKVLSINTSGQITSGVTTYPTTILFDPTTVEIYPKMSVASKIIIEVQNDVVLIPSAAVLNNNGQTSVRVLKDNKIETVSVEVSGTDGSQSAIYSGINEGDIVVTNIINSNSTNRNQNSTGTSPFNMFGSNRNFNAGGTMRIVR